MNKHIQQYTHNQEFLTEICNKCPDTFFDWKTTVVLYCCIHLIRGLAEREGKILGNRHNHVFDYLENKTSKKSKIYRSFYVIYKNSRDVRYNGFTNRKSFESFSHTKFNQSLTLLEKIKGFVTSQGVEISQLQRL